MSKKRLNWINYCLLFVVIAFLNCSSTFANVNITPDESMARGLLQSLQNGVTVYLSKQNSEPATFKDFVTPSGVVYGPYSTSLEQLNPYLKSIEGMDSSKLVLRFNSGLEATYILTGSNVKGIFSEVSNQSKLQDSELLAGIFFVFAGVLVVFIFSALIFVSRSNSFMH